MAMAWMAEEGRDRVAKWRQQHSSLANEMKKKVKETVKSEFLLWLLLAHLCLLLLLPLPTIISWRFFFFLFFKFLTFLASSRAANVSVAATCAFYLRFVYCLPMIDERISFQVLVSVGQQRPCACVCGCRCELGIKPIWRWMNFYSARNETERVLNNQNA